MENKRKYVLILLSGGIDSAACIKHYKDLNFLVEGLFVNYNQLAYNQEKKAVKKISDYFNIDLFNIKTNITPTVNRNGIINGRNLLLIAIAISCFKHSHGLISLGIHKGTYFPDCSKEFINKSQKLLDLYSKGNVIIDCPFIDFTKMDIYNYCLQNKVPLELTYSCEYGLKQPCGKCSTCLDLTRIYENTN